MEGGPPSKRLCQQAGVLPSPSSRIIVAAAHLVPKPYRGISRECLFYIPIQVDGLEKKLCLVVLSDSYVPRLMEDNIQVESIKKHYNHLSAEEKYLCSLLRSTFPPDSRASIASQVKEFLRGHFRVSSNGDLLRALLDKPRPSDSPECGIPVFDTPVVLSGPRTFSSYDQAGSQPSPEGPLSSPEGDQSPPSQSGIITDWQEMLQILTDPLPSIT